MTGCTACLQEVPGPQADFCFIDIAHGRNGQGETVEDNLFQTTRRDFRGTSVQCCLACRLGEGAILIRKQG